FQLSESEPGMGSWTNESMAWRTFTDQRDHATYFSSIAPYFTWSNAPLGRGEGAAKVRAVLATPEYFGLLGVQPALGRFYRDEEDRPVAGSPVAGLCLRYWCRSRASSARPCPTRESGWRSGSPASRWWCSSSSAPTWRTSSWPARRAAGGRSPCDWPWAWGAVG